MCPDFAEGFYELSLFSLSGEPERETYLFVGKKVGDINSPRISSIEAGSRNGIGYHFTLGYAHV